MKFKSKILTIILTAVGLTSYSQNLKSDKAAQHYFIDVHNLEPGKVHFNDVAVAHEKDLATQGKYGVHFIKYWVDEKEGKVYCLSSASDSSQITATHREAHGLIPDAVYEVTEGQAASMNKNKNLYLDIHQLGAGNVKAADVAEAHKKDLAVQNQYGVNFIDYWVDESKGVVFCLSEAAKEEDVIKTHKQAHGLIPAEVLTVKQGE